MTLKNYQGYYSPVLKVLDSHGPLHRRYLAELVAALEGVSEEDQSRANDRGTVLFYSRVHWAAQYLIMAGAVHRPARGQMEITQRGKELLALHPLGFTDKELERFPEWQAWIVKSNRSRPKKSDQGNAIARLESEEGLTPEEKMSAAMDELEASVAADLVSRIQELSPAFLEKLVLELLHKMGYGDSQDDLTHSGTSGDEGVDGVIKQDKLGLQNLFIQAKRYMTGNTVGRPAIQAFAGAMLGKSNAGVFITTSSFSREACEYASAQSSHRITLIDGEKLGRLLLEYEIGIRVRRVHKYVEVDEEYFAD